MLLVASIWIACSSGVIIFNKWVLATAKFSKSSPTALPARDTASCLACSSLPCLLHGTSRLIFSPLVLQTFVSSPVALPHPWRPYCDDSDLANAEPSSLPDDMAHVLLDMYDPVHGPIYKPLGFAPQGPHDPPHLHVSSKHAGPGGSITAKKNRQREGQAVLTRSDAWQARDCSYWHHV